MKILILTSSHPKISAGIVAFDLLNGLSYIKGNDVKILVRAWDQYEDSRITSIESTLEHYFNRAIRFCKRAQRKILNLIFKKYRTREELDRARYIHDFSFEYDLTKKVYSTKKILKRAGFIPEIVLVLFMPQFISFKNLYEIYKLTNATIFLYLMDMAPFTGGCHYAWNCLGYIRECEMCQAAKSFEQNRNAHMNYTYKKKYIEKTKISAIGASEWQYLQLNKSSLFKDKRKYKVLLPINEKVFHSSDKNSAREELGLPYDKKIIFFGAVSVDEKRKGFNELIETLDILFHNLTDPSKIHLVIAGNNSSYFKDSLRFSYSMLGFLDQNKLAKAFQTADVFVSPSIEDSGPMMINQSIMCGTPVVSFKTGVAQDLIKNKETGYLAKLRDTNDFSEGIKYIIELNQLESNIMSLKCRETGIRLCKQEKICKELMEIFIRQV